MKFDGREYWFEPESNWFESMQQLCVKVGIDVLREEGLPAKKVGAELRRGWRL